MPTDCTWTHKADEVVITCGDVEATLPRTERTRKLIGRCLRHAPMTPARLAAIERHINVTRAERAPRQ